MSCKEVRPRPCRACNGQAWLVWIQKAKSGDECALIRVCCACNPGGRRPPPEWSGSVLPEEPTLGKTLRFRKEQKANDKWVRALDMLKRAVEGWNKNVRSIDLEMVMQAARKIVELADAAAKKVYCEEKNDDIHP